MEIATYSPPCFLYLDSLSPCIRIWAWPSFFKLDWLLRLFQFRENRNLFWSSRGRKITWSGNMSNLPGICIRFILYHGIWGWNYFTYSTGSIFSSWIWLSFLLSTLSSTRICQGAATSFPYLIHNQTIWDFLSVWRYSATDRINMSFARGANDSSPQTHYLEPVMDSGLCQCR